MRVRDIIGLILALILAVGVAFLTRLFLTKQENVGQEVAVKTEKITKVLVASKNLSPGDTVKVGDFVWQEWPKDTLTSSYITEEQAKPEDFIGSIVRFPIHKSNPVVKDELVKKGDKGILAAVVAPGKRAVSVDITASGSDSGLIFPGDYVDVIVSTTVAERSIQVGKSKTVLKNIKVLALDTTLATPNENPKTPPHVATLEMTPQEAEVLVAAAKEGTISLSLHSMEKGEPVHTPMEAQDPVKKPEDRKIILMRGKETSEVQFQEK
jgi:pilus assembly protein CpaB